MDSKEYLELLRGRFSVRAFTDEQLTDEELSTILEAARLSPTARNDQPFRICIVQSPEGLAKVDECTKCRYGAPTVLICAYDVSASAKGLGCETGDFGDIDTSIAITNMANAAYAAGLGSCWVGAYDIAATRERFNVPTGYMLVDMLMLGHPAADCEPGPGHSQSRTIEELTFRESF